MLDTLKRNNSEIKMQNLYKGLTITNKGLVHSTDKDKIVLQSNFLQQKGAQKEGRVLLSSEFFPYDIICETIKKVDYEQQTIEVDGLKFLETSFSKRKSIRLEPDEKHTASIIYQDHKFGDEVKVVDISIDAVKISMLSLPAGFSVDESVIVDMVFTLGNKHIIINAPSRVKKIINTKDHFYIVLFLEPSSTAKKTLLDYMAKRQMELIREFKGLQYGK